MTVECRLCEVEMTDTKALQNEDKHCIRIKNLMEDPNSKFPEETDIAMKMSFYATKLWIWEKNTKQLLFLNH